MVPLVQTIHRLFGRAFSFPGVRARPAMLKDNCKFDHDVPKWKQDEGHKSQAQRFIVRCRN